MERGGGEYLTFFLLFKYYELYRCLRNVKSGRQTAYAKKFKLGWEIALFNIIVFRERRVKKSNWGTRVQALSN